MSLQVLVAHTGERHFAEPSSFDSVEAFKAWLAKAASVPAPYQILLTGAGKQVKLQALQAEVCGAPHTVHDIADFRSLRYTYITASSFHPLAKDIVIPSHYS